MNVLLIGSGGREHAIAWKLAQSKNLTKLYIAPGNPGTAECGENVPIGSDDTAKLLEFAKQNEVELVVVGRPCRENGGQLEYARYFSAAK